MDVLIVEDDLSAQVALAQEVMRRGLGVICMGDLDSAEAMLRHQVPRAVILGEWVGGRLSHRLALLSEYRRPDVAVILLSCRTGADLDEVPDLLPAVRAILGRDFSPDSVGQIVAAVLNPGGRTQVRLRGDGALRQVARKAVADLAGSGAVRPLSGAAPAAMSAAAPAAAPLAQPAADDAALTLPLTLPRVGAAEPMRQPGQAGALDETTAAGPVPQPGPAAVPAAPARFWPLAAYRAVARQTPPMVAAETPAEPRHAPAGGHADAVPAARVLERPAAPVADLRAAPVAELSAAPVADLPAAPVADLRAARVSERPAVPVTDLRAAPVADLPPSRAADLPAGRVTDLLAASVTDLPAVSRPAALRAVAPALPPGPVAAPAPLRRASQVLPHLEPAEAAPGPGVAPPSAFDWPAWLAAAAATPVSPRPAAAAPRGTAATGSPTPVRADRLPDAAERPRLAAGGRRLTLG